MDQPNFYGQLGQPAEGQWRAARPAWPWPAGAAGQSRHEPAMTRAAGAGTAVAPERPPSGLDQSCCRASSLSVAELRHPGPAGCRTAAQPGGGTPGQPKQLTCTRAWMALIPAAASSSSVACAQQGQPLLSHGAQLLLRLVGELSKTQARPRRVLHELFCALGHALAACPLVRGPDAATSARTALRRRTFSSALLQVFSSE